MTLDQVQALVTIVESGSFNAASVILKKAQSALSTAIRNLEEEFNVRIFDRSQYRASLTAEGKALYQQALILQKEEARFVKVARQLSSKRETQIKLSIDAICPFGPIKTTLNDFAKKFPEVSLQLHLENLGGAMELFSDSKVDLALIEMESPNDMMTLEPWGLVKFVPVAAPSHVLSSKSKIVESDTQGLVQIIVKSSRRHSESADANISKHSVRWVVPDFSTKLDLLTDGFGWGFMPLHLVETKLHNGSLVKLKIACEFAESLTQTLPGKTIRDSTTIFLAKHKDRALGPVGSELWKLFVTCKTTLDLNSK